MRKRKVFGILGVLVALGIVAAGIPHVAASSVSSAVTLKVIDKDWYAESDVSITIYYTVVESPYFGVEYFAPLYPPYNHVHFGTHSGTSSMAYWTSCDASTSPSTLQGKGDWVTKALINRYYGDAYLAVFIDTVDSSPYGVSHSSVGRIASGTGVLMVQYYVDSEGSRISELGPTEIPVGEPEEYSADV